MFELANNISNPKVVEDVGVVEDINHPSQEEDSVDDYENVIY